MPDPPPDKRRPRAAREVLPFPASTRNRAHAERAAPLPGYAELHCRTNYSFLTGASHPDELAARAVELGYAALAITDRESLSGVVRAA